MSGAFDPTLKDLNDCGCCQGLSVQTPVMIKNRPGLSAIVYRVGTHSRFKENMLVALSGTQKWPALSRLRTREDSDLSIALLDAWASIADVLTFYQERIANESYLRTATERRSIAYLGELIGYHLKPGVAATAYLAFTVDEETGTAQVDKGTQVKSLPADGGLPQTFETSHALTARFEWNTIKPRLLQPQTLYKGMKSVVLKGADLNIKVGDSLLIIYPEQGQKKKQVRKVFQSVSNAKDKTTRVDFEGVQKLSPQVFQVVAYNQATFLQQKAPLTQQWVQTQLLGKTWSAGDLFAQADYQGWSYLELSTTLQQLAQKATPPADTGVFVFRKRAAVFGHNAPQFTYVEDGLPPKAVTWENRNLLADTEGNNYLYLDNVYPEITSGSWVALKRPGSAPTTYQVQNVEEVSRADFTLSARVTRLKLDHITGFANFKMRTTEVLVQSEKLELAEIPIPNDVQGETLQLAGDVDIQGLKTGKKVILSGKPKDNPHVTKQEVATIDEIRLENGLPVVEFIQSLSHIYLRDSVVLYGNVAEATHGEVQQEILGSGDGTETWQKFTLKNKPLTYVPATTTSGSESTLKVRVDGLLWKEAPDLARLKPADRAYIIRTDDHGNTRVIFGDGKHGMRPSTGQENITASYRSGSGLKGNLKAKTLTLLSKRPPGVRAVTNPLPAVGGADGESRANARRNAPKSVLTLDRVVSLQDYEDFARAYAGIDKALATKAWQGQAQAVHLTVSGPRGAAVNAGGKTHQNLLTSIQGASPEGTPIKIQSYTPVRFQIRGKVKVADNRLRKKVLADLDQKLRSQFSYRARQFGQQVTISEVMAVIQNVPGITAVDIDALFKTGASQIWNAVLRAARPLPGTALESIQPAELLTLDPRPIKWGEMK